VPRRPQALSRRQIEEGRCPAVVSGEFVHGERINGIIDYDSVAFIDPWLSK
jgi:hypothetical protein